MGPRERLRRWQCLVALWEDAFIRLVDREGPLCDRRGKCRLVRILLKTSLPIATRVCVLRLRTGRQSLFPIIAILVIAILVIAILVIAILVIATAVMATLRTVASTASS